jgi:oligoribonuclease NrnB/cAMP/cGMP phosphodiesterase (DHH superfamily)
MPVLFFKRAFPQKERFRLDHYSNLLCVHSDLDGIATEVLSQFFSLNFDKTVSYDYEFFDDPVKVKILLDADSIVFSDISPSQELYNSLVSSGKIIRIFDHHESSLWIKDKPGCVHDNGRSGTKIFFEEYALPVSGVGRFPMIVREFVELVSVYDLWQLDSPLRPMSEDLQRAFVKYGNWGLDDNLARHDRFISATVKKLQKQGRFSWNRTELMYIQEARASEDKAYREAMSMLQTRWDNKGRKFGVYSAWGKISMVCHRMLSIDKMDVSYIVCVQTFHGKLGQISFRSRDGEFNLLELAGVAGHKVSAGASLSPEEIKCFLQENMCFKYKENLKTNDDSSIIEECK